MKELSKLVVNAKQENKIISVDDAIEDLPSWEDFFGIFKSALELSRSDKDGYRHLASYTFGTAGIDKSHMLSEKLDSIVDIAKSIHKGEFMSALSIVHFLNATDNDIPEEAKEFYEFFRSNCPEPVPPGFEQYMIPTRHSDPIDGIYVQCLGNTFWTAYYEDHVEKFALKPGDIIIIPKGVEHTVESLTPRVGLSLALAD